MGAQNFRPAVTSLRAGLAALAAAIVLASSAPAQARGPDGIAAHPISIAVPALPRLGNGKPDRRALLALASARLAGRR